jgi:hypothetical protein
LQMTKRNKIMKRSMRGRRIWTTTSVLMRRMRIRVPRRKKVVMVVKNMTQEVKLVLVQAPRKVRAIRTRQILKQVLWNVLTYSTFSGPSSWWEVLKIIRLVYREPARRE